MYVSNRIFVCTLFYYLVCKLIHTSIQTLDCIKQSCANEVCARWSIEFIVKLFQFRSDCTMSYPIIIMPLKFYWKRWNTLWNAFTIKNKYDWCDQLEIVWNHLMHSKVLRQSVICICYILFCFLFFSIHRQTLFNVTKHRVYTICWMSAHRNMFKNRQAIFFRS